MAVLTGVSSFLPAIVAPPPASRPASQSGSQPSSQPGRPSTVRLKVLTYNVQHCPAGLDRLVAFIRGQNADLIFLQENTRDRSAPTDQARQIAAALGGLNVVSVTTLGLPPEQGCDQAILSRFELTDARALFLETGGRSFAVRATAKIGDTRLAVISVHTHATVHLNVEHVTQTSDTRLREISALLDEVRATDTDLLVAGDFNATPWMPEYYGLTRVLTDLGLVSKDAKLSFPSHRPNVRIDYVFGRGEFTGRSYQVLNVLLSDHRPVIVEMDWDAGQEPSKAPTTTGAA